MEISTNTLTQAMSALAAEIERTRAALEAQADQDRIDEGSQRLFDLQVAAAELDTLYAERRLAHPALPPSEDWLPSSR
jgi:VIT1/CCC1 family predicted Fe2+/Mn2+ transporter